MDIGRIMRIEANKIGMRVSYKAIDEFEKLLEDWIEGVIIPNAAEHAKNYGRKTIDDRDIIYAKSILWG